MDPRVFIAAAAVGLVLCLFAAAMIGDGVSQWNATHRYIPPPYLVELCTHVINVSITVLGFTGVLGGIAEWRKRKQDKSDK